MTHKHKRLFVAIWTAALFINVLLLFLYYWSHSKGLVGDEVGYISRAMRIAQGEDVQRLPVWPPGYDYFLSLPLYLAEAVHFPQPLLFPQFFQIILWIVSGIVFWKITEQLLSTDSLRILALSLYLLNPTLTAFSHYFWPEIPHLTLYLTALLILIKYPTSLIWNGVLGVLLAIAALLKLVYLPISLILISLIFIIRFFRNERLTPALISILLFLCVLAPTLLNNLETHHKLMIADSTVFNIWVGLNDKELTDWHKNSIVSHEFNNYLNSAQTHNERNEIYLNKIRNLVLEQGLAQTLINQLKKQYIRLFDRRTFFTKQLPGGMNKKYSFSNVELANTLRIWNDIIWGITLLGFGIGVLSPWKKSLAWTHLLTGIVFYNIVLFLVLHVKTRYVIQFLPMLSIISASGLDRLWHCFFNSQSEFDFLSFLLREKRMIFGVLLSGALLFFAFRDVFL